MPWKIIKNGNEFCVHKENSDGTAGKKVSCHKTEQDAKDHMAALYASESKSGARHSKQDMKIIARAHDAASQIQQHMRELGHGVVEGDNGTVIVPGTTSLKGEESLDQQVQIIRNAFYEKFNPPDSNANIWVREVFEDYLIVDSSDDGMFKVTYSKAEDGGITFEEKGKWIEVEMEYVEAKSMSEMESIPGSAVKISSEGKLGGMLVAFATPDNVDGYNDYFDKDTDFGFEGEIKSPVYLHHCLPVKTAKGIQRITRAIGQVTLKLVENGVEVIDGELFDWLIKSHDEYVAYIAKTVRKAIEAGKMGWSSGTVNHLVVRSKKGDANHIDKWPLGLDATLTSMPAGLMQGTMASIKTIKELEISDDSSSENGGNPLNNESQNQNNNDNKSDERNYVMITKEQVIAEAAKLGLTLTEAEIDACVKANKLPEKPAAKSASPMVDALERVKLEMQAEEELKAAKAREESELVNRVKDLITSVKKGQPADEARKGSAALNLKTQRGDDENKAFWHFLRTGDINAYKTTRILNEADDEQGAALVPTGFYNKIVEKRDEVSVARAAGAMVLQTDLKVVNIPVENEAEAAPVLTAESGAGGDGATEVSYDVNTVEPVDTKAVTVYKYTRMIKISEELLNDQKANLEAFLGSRLGRAFGVLENTLFLTGTGGALYGSGKGHDAAAADAIAASDVMGLYYGLAQPYRNGAAWVMEGATEAAIRQLTGSAFAFVQMPQGTAGNVGIETLVGNQRVFNADCMPSIGASTSGNIGKSILFGNFEYFCIVERQGLTIKRLNERFADTGEIGILASIRVGSAITQTDAMKHLLHPTG